MAREHARCLVDYYPAGVGLSPKHLAAQGQVA